MIKNSFWANKRVFISGHSGFKGSWLTLWLNLMGAKICGYSLKPNSSPSLYEVINIKNYCENNVGDVLNFIELKKVLSVE